MTEDLVALRRTLHAGAELSMQEHGTTALVRSVLAEAGVEPLRCPTPTGAVAVVRGRRSDRSVLLRADIDGLPLRERTGLPFAAAGEAMHACGHDVHTAVLLDVARSLQAAGDLPCDVLLVFQPGEELAGGARAMLAGGLLDPEVLAAQGCVLPSAATGLHVTSLAPLGVVGITDGTVLSGADVFEVEVSGRGGHGASGVGGPLRAAAELVTRLGEVVAGMSLSGTDAACSAGVLSAGSASNVLPDRARVVGTLRTFGEEQRQEALARLSGLLADVDRAAGTTSRLVLGLDVPPVVNDADVAAAVRPAFAAAGLQPLVLPPLSPSDDVSELFGRVPGCFAFVGAAPDDDVPHDHHSATFDVDEAVLPLAAAALAGAARVLAERAVSGPAAPEVRAPAGSTSTTPA